MKLKKRNYFMKQTNLFSEIGDKIQCFIHKIPSTPNKLKKKKN